MLPSQGEEEKDLQAPGRGPKMPYTDIVLLTALYPSQYQPSFKNSAVIRMLSTSEAKKQRYEVNDYKDPGINL